MAIKTQRHRTKENGNITGRKSKASWKGVTKRIKERTSQVGKAPRGAPKRSTACQKRRAGRPAEATACACHTTESWAQNRRQPTKVIGKVETTTTLSAPEQQRKPVNQGFQERQKPREIMQDRQIEEPQPGQENTRRDAERQKNVVGWTSEPYTPYQKGTGRPSSRFGSMGSRHTRHK